MRKLRDIILISVQYHATAPRGAQQYVQHDIYNFYLKNEVSHSRWNRSEMFIPFEVCFRVAIDSTQRGCRGVPIIQSRENEAIQYTKPAKERNIGTSQKRKKKEMSNVDKNDHKNCQRMDGSRSSMIFKFALSVAKFHLRFHSFSHHELGCIS